MQFITSSLFKSSVAWALLAICAAQVHAQEGALRQSEKFDRDAPTMSEAELVDLDRILQRRQREFREDLAQRLNEERTLFLAKADRVIKRLAEADKLDIIFQESVYFNPHIDITDKVIKALNK